MQLCIQLNIGDKKIKKVSLRCINKILQHEDGGAIEAFSNKKLIDILIKMLTFGQDKERIPKFRDEEFDDYLAECIETIQQRSNGETLDSRLITTVHNSITWVVGSTQSVKMKNTMVKYFKEVLKEYWNGAIIALFPFLTDETMRDSMVDCFRDFLRNEVPSNKKRKAEDEDDVVEDVNSDDEVSEIVQPQKKRKIDVSRKLDLTFDLDSPFPPDNSLSEACMQLFTEFAQQTKVITDLEPAILSEEYTSHFKVVDTMIRSCIYVIQDIEDSNILETMNKLFSTMVECMNCHLKVRPVDKKEDPFVKEVLALLEEIHKAIGFDYFENNVKQAILNYIQAIVENDQHHRVLHIPFFGYFSRSFLMKERCSKLTDLIKHTEEKVRAAAIRALPVFVKNNGAQMASVILSEMRKCLPKNSSEAVLKELGMAVGQVVRHAYGNDRKKGFSLTDNTVFFGLLDDKKPKSVRKAFLESVPFFIKSSPKEDIANNRAAIEKCISLIADHDTAIRIKFASTIDCFVTGDATPIKVYFNQPNATADESIQLLFKHISSYISEAKSNKKHLSLQSLLITLGHIGAHANGDALVSILFFFLEGLVSDQTYSIHSIATAYDQIRYIARAKSTPDQARLFDPFREYLNDWIYSKLSDKNMLIKMVAEAIFDTNEQEFLMEALPSILPKLVKNRHKDKLVQLSTAIKKSVRDLVVENLEEIFVHLFMEDAMSDEFLVYILGTLCELPLKGNKEINYSLGLIGLSTKLILQLGDYDKNKYNLVVKALTFISKKLSLESYKIRLNDHFLGIMDVITSVITTDKNPQERVRCLICFDNLLRILGSSQRCYTKVMSFLKDAMEDEVLLPTACDVWYTFICESDNNALKHHLGQIAVILLPYVEKETEKIVKVLEELIIVQEDIFRDALIDIPYLPNIPALNKVNSVIEKQVGTMTFNAQINRLVGMTHHENSNVVVMCLAQLKTMLQQKQDEFRSSVISDETLINTLVYRLLSGCNDSNFDVRSACTECLGVVGALDPSILSIPTKSDTREQVTAVELARSMITDYGIKCLKDSQTKHHDQVCYAIQELLRFIHRQTSQKVPEEKETKEKNQRSAPLKLQDMDRDPWWRGLTEQQREAITPLLDSAYYVTSDSLPRHFPIYKPKMSQTKWLRIWISELCKRGDGLMSVVFVYSKLIVGASQAAGMFILPYAVYHVIRVAEQEEHRDNIRKEIMAVLEHMDSDVSEHAQTVFALVELLKKWLDIDIRTYGLERRKNPTAELHIKRVTDLIQKIPKDILARSAMINNAYTRAIKYYEEYLRQLKPAKEPFLKSSMVTAEQVAQLQKIYSKLDEPDGLVGIATLRTSTSLQEQILDDESSGKWIEAMHCYELALQKEPDSMEHHLNLLKCFRNLGHLQTMLRNIDGALTRLRDTKTNVQDLHTYAVQSAWRLGQWSLVEEFQTQANPTDFEYGIAQALLAYRKRDKEQFKEIIERTRRELIIPLSAASMESYQRSYPYIVQAQMLNELEQSFVLWDYSTGNDTTGRMVIASDKLKKFANNMEQSIKLTMESLHTREPLLSLRRVIYNIHGLDSEVGKSWLSWAKLAREVGHLQTASSAILQARSNPPPNFYIENAKLLWDQGLGPQAIALVDSARQFQLQTDKVGDLDLNLIRAKMMLMAVKWNDKTRHKSSEEVTKSYEEVIKMEQQWEMGYFNLARYKDMLFTNEIDKVQKTVQSQEYTSGRQGHQNEALLTQLEPYKSILPDVLKNYGYSLLYGYKNLYNALPRMLTLLFSAGTFLHQALSKLTKQNKSVIEKIMNQYKKIMDDHIQHVPPYMWFVAFSQIVSRITHENSVVKDIVRQMVELVIVRYTPQTLWSLSFVLNHNVKERKMEAEQILRNVKNTDDDDVRDMIEQAEELFTALLALCPKKVVKDETATTINLKDYRFFKNIMDNPPTSLIVPLQKQFNVTLPQRASKTGKLDTEYDPFPEEPIHFKNFENKVVLMNSLQKPKKLTINTSNGEQHYFLAKEDDLRKDHRMMELNSILNRFMKKTPDTRRRKLYIRTFAAIPLNDQYGLVEWVKNTNTYRNCIKDAYRMVNLKEPSSTETKGLYGGNCTTVNAFKNKILPKYTPVFHAWFSQTFPEPTKWFESRLNYARTTAVMSMVGYMVGLGDRHSENILLDQSNGDLIHVDFSMLFDKGKTLSTPEVVPFRLTQNMIDAFGITGYEGVYRSVCEQTMKVLRENKEPLINVLETLVHDPLVEWNKSKATQTNHVKQNHSSASPDKTMRRMAGKLQGQMEESGMPLSVQGQVDSLIASATAPEQLCQMYIWWMSFL
jgi:serine/threonine-protein kinase ATR